VRSKNLNEQNIGKVRIFVSFSHENEDWVFKEGKYKLIPWLEKLLDD
jgi:hypothetical protein